MDLLTQARQLRQERVDLVKRARVILDTASGEKRDLSSEEQAKWDQMMSDVDALKKRVDDLDKQRDAEDDVEEDKRDDPESDDKKEDDDEPRSRQPRKSARANKPSPGGSRVLGTPEQLRRSTPEYRDAFKAYMLSGEKALTGKHARAIQADSDILGGYMVPPQEFVATLIKAVNSIVYIRQKATKFTVNASQSLGVPSLDADPADADWTSELATGNEDSTMAFGKRELHPHPLAKRLKVSRKLLRLAQFSGYATADGTSASGGADGLVMDRLAYKFGTTEEAAFLTGTGVQQPLGLFTASAKGISTGRDVAMTGTTYFTADDLMNVKFNVKAQYHKNAEWILHRLMMKKIRQLKDGIGQYLWGPGLGDGSPDTLLDNPVNVSEIAPSTFTTGQYITVYGDLSFYWIADSEQMTIQRLEELYAEANQVGFIARLELDGMPVLEEAFSRAILA